MTRPDWTEVDTVETSLALAIKLRDGFTGEQSRESPRVRLVDRPEQVIRNRSGHYLVTDLPDDVTTVTVYVDAGDAYHPVRREIERSAPSDAPAIVELELLPAPAYRFPADATLVRGTVREATDDGTAKPLSDVDLAVETESDDADDVDDSGFTAKGRTTDQGEYVLFFRGVSAEYVQEAYDDAGDDESDRPDGRVIHVNGEKPVVRADHRDSSAETTVPVGVTLGGTTSLDIEL